MESMQEVVTLCMGSAHVLQVYLMVPQRLTQDGVLPSTYTLKNLGWILSRPAVVTLSTVEDLRPHCDISQKLSSSTKLSL